MKKNETVPPAWMLSLLKLIVHPDYYEDIAGDLMEMYSLNVEKLGIKKANRIFFREVLFLVRPNLIGLNFFNKNMMKKRDFLVLGSVCMVLLVLIMLPFLQGSFSIVTVVASGISQAIGFVGIVFIPIGITGIAITRFNRSKNNPDKSRYGRIITLSAVILAMLFYTGLDVALFMNGDIKAGIITLVVGLVFGYRVMVYLQNSSKLIPFQKIYVYLIFVPLVAFFGRKFMAFELSRISRNETIEQASVWINEIENYKQSTGQYPDSIHELKTTLPQPRYMGIREFTYERVNETYNLSFVQWVDMGAVQEVVVYSNTDTYNMKGYFARYDAPQPNWKYFWLD